MLTQSDVDWIRDNRAEMLANRTESVTIYHVVNSGTDPYTGEPIAGEAVPETVAVVWKEYQLRGDRRELVGGVELREGDVRVSFDPSINLAAVKRIVRGSIDYELVAHDGRGIGGKNRVECVVRRVT